MISEMKKILTSFELGFMYANDFLGDRVPPRCVIYFLPFIDQVRANRSIEPFEIFFACFESVKNISVCTV
jgi:hypothetical protein